MKCMYAEELGIQVPDRLILTDNGAFDLQKQGIAGSYVWIGYRHGKGVSARTMEDKMVHFMNCVVIPAMINKLGVKEEQVHRQNFINSMDMFRVYVEE